MIVAAYARVSTGSEEQETSLTNQKSYFEREIEAHGHTLYKVYYDEGLTGTKLNNRAGFEEMLKDAGIDINMHNTNVKDGRNKFKHTLYDPSDRKPLFDEIWIKNTSRFARNTMSYELITLLRQQHVNIFFIEQNINSSDMTQDLVLKLMQVFDSQDSVDKSSKVKWGINESIKQGAIRTNHKLYGYKLITETNSLEIIPDEAKIIQTVFDLYSQGLGTRRTANELTKRGMFTRYGKEFCKSSIRAIITQEKYMGYSNSGKRSAGVVFSKTYSKVKDNYEIQKSDRIPAIVSEELFKKCNGMLKGKISYVNQKGMYKGLSKYSQKLICANCGGVYYGNTYHAPNERYVRKYYNCANKKNHTNTFCDNPNVSEKTVDAYIQRLADHEAYEIIQEQKLKSVTIIFNVLRLKFEQISKDSTDEANQLLEQIKDKEERLESYNELYVTNKSSRESLKQKIDALDNEIIDLQDQYKEATKSNDAIVNDIVELYDLYIYIEEMDRGKEHYSIEEIMNMIDKIYVFKNRKTGKPILNAPLEKSEQLDALVNQYKELTSFNPLTHEEIKWINDQLELYIEFD